KLAVLDASRFHDWHRDFTPQNARQAILAQCAACNLRANGLNQYLADKVGVMAVMQQKTGLAQA
ncbi:hypothetical protein ACLBPK_16400, partial [Klebsiella pneumoniae]